MIPDQLYFKKYSEGVKARKGSEERLDRHVDDHEDQEQKLNPRDEEDPREPPFVLRIRRALLRDQLADPPRLRTQETGAGQKRQDPHAKPEGEPEIAELPGALTLVDQPEAEDDQQQR